MSIVVIALVSFAASALTLVSGFGLGTMLLPVFLLFFDVELAVAATAVVHLLNNIFKFALMQKSINKKVLLLFGVPGILGAFFGAWLLNRMVDLAPVEILGQSISPIKGSIGVLMIFFALTEFFPKLLQFDFSAKALIPGGAISGFFGGLSGHQGALRSMFLIKVGMGKSAYIATGVAIALLVDLTRIPVYFSSDKLVQLPAIISTLAVATISAFAGAFLGKKLIPKITLRAVHILVGTFMILMGAGLIADVL